MELKAKYQYSYFIYPYVVKEDRYDKYMLKLIRNKKCNIRFFEKEKDFDIYSYFLPTLREYLFSTFEYSKLKIRKFQELDFKMQAAILSKYPCTVFEYDLKQDIQGKTGQRNGIFFKIQKIELICFQTGICFLAIKTNIEESNKFSDVLDFNYKFRDIHSEFKALKEFENIKIQSDIFQNSKQLSEVIKELTGSAVDTKKIDIDTDRFLTYAYTCIDQEEWNDKKSFENVENEFLKYANVLPSSYNSNFERENIKEDLKIISKWKYRRWGFTRLGSTLLASGIDMENYTKLPFAYENEYFYTYILALYQRIYLKKLMVEFKKSKKKEQMRKEFIKFTKELYLQDITDNDTGGLMYQRWKEVLEINELYLTVKEQYEVLYKELDIEKDKKVNKFILVVLAISLLLNIWNFILLFGNS